MTKPARTPGKNLTSAERQSIIEAYAEGASITTIQRQHGYTKPTVRRAVLRDGGQLRGDAVPAKFSDHQLRAWCRYGWTVRRIAEQTGAKQGTVKERLSKIGLRTIKASERLPASEIIEAYMGGDSLRELSTLHDADIRTIRRIIVKHGVSIRTSSQPRSISPQQLAEYCRQGLTVPQISEATGVGRDSIRAYLADNGLQVADRRPGHERAAISQITTPQQATE